jgi:hypothetical protein
LYHVELELVVEGCGQIVRSGGVVEELRRKSLQWQERMGGAGKPRRAPELLNHPRARTTTQPTEHEAPSRFVNSCSNWNFRSSTLADGILNGIVGNHQQIKSQDKRKHPGSKWNRH